MFSRRSILYAFVLLFGLLSPSADASDALERYHTRLQEITRSYYRQFSEIRKNQRQIGSGRGNIRATEQQFKRLAMMRNRAIAEALLAYLREEKPADLPPSAYLSQEQRENEAWAAQLQSVEEGQKAFWVRAAREETENGELWAAVILKEARIGELWTARLQTVEEEQTAFWAQIFQAPKIPRPSVPVSAPLPKTAATPLPPVRPLRQLASVN